ncbi:MAG: NACHT domain-containing protein [Sphingomonas sp.]
MTQKALFVCSAKSSPKLDYGEQDCKRIIATLTNANYGGGDVVMPVEPLFDCPTSGRFLNGLTEFLSEAEGADQCILYFTGHGAWSAQQFAFEFDGKGHVPFSIAETLLRQSTKRYLFIIDACHSGGATGHKSSGTTSFAVSSGSCVLASCREIEISRELPGHGSLFTDYFCKAIETGLGNKKTPKGMISVNDLVEFVNDKMTAHLKDEITKQTSNFTISQGEGAFWIAANISGELTDTPAPLGPTQHNDLHRVPPEGASYADLDEDAVFAFARRFSGALLPGIEAARTLGLFFSKSDERPTAAAILCFGQDPQHFFPNATAGFSAVDGFGRSASDHLEGTLLAQFERLVELTLNNLERRTFHSAKGVRRDDYEISSDVLREIIANALTHRDFEGAGRVQVRVTDEYVEVLNPGAFPEGHDWQSLLDKPGASLTGNRRIANFLRKLGAAEGIGQGFRVLKAFRDETGQDALWFEAEAGVVRCFVKRPPRPDHAVAPELIAALEGEAENQLALALQTQARSVERVSVFNELFELNQIFVAPQLGDERGNTVEFAEIAHRIAGGQGFQALIVGAAGMGKTTLLKKIAFDLSRTQPAATNAQLDGDPAEEGAQPLEVVDPFTLFLPLRTVNTDRSLMSALADQVGLRPSTLDRLLRLHRVVLLLDGFDEIGPTQRALVADEIAALAAARPELTIVVTSRPIEYLAHLLPEGRTYSIKPFTRDQALTLIGRSRPEVPLEMLRKLADGSDLLSNPLFALIASRIAGQSATIPVSTTDFVSLLVETVLHRHDASKSLHRRHRVLDADNMLQLMRMMALVMITNGITSLDKAGALNLIHNVSRFVRSPSHLIVEDDFSQVLNDILELGVFLTRDGEHIVASYRTVVEHLAVEGAGRTIMDQRQLAVLVVKILTMYRSLPLAAAFINNGGLPMDRRQAEHLIKLLKAEGPIEPSEPSMLLESLIADLEQKLPTYRDSASDIFGLGDAS